MINVTSLRVEDLSEYRDLLKASFSDPNSLEQFQSSYDPDGAIKIFVARNNNRIVGAITAVKVELFTFADRPVLMLFDVCVLPTMRRAGIAAKLMASVKDYARTVGCKSISLTCLDSSTAAINFYENQGFTRRPVGKYLLSPV